jgi:hypothetical protein
MVIASQTLVLFGWSLGLQVLVILGGILSVISVGILLFVVNAWSETKQNSSYEWQPDLSHNVVEYNTVPGSRGGHSLMTTLPKSLEQLDEEKRAYLKERKSYD